MVAFTAASSAPALKARTAASPFLKLVAIVEL